MFIDVIKDCNRLGAEGKITFAEVVSRFLEAGIERYQVDFVLGSNTYYTVNGETHIEPSHKHPVSAKFEAEKIADAVKQSQQGKITYPRFIDLITKAGCSNYTAYLTGKRVIYSGRQGDSHIELFPHSKN